MPSKVVYTDNGKDIALSGEILKEDDHFIVLKSNRGKTYRIGKKSITLIKNAGDRGGEQ